MVVAVVAVIEVVVMVAVEVVVVAAVVMMVAVAVMDIKLYYGTAADSIEQPMHC